MSTESKRMFQKVKSGLPSNDDEPSLDFQPFTRLITPPMESDVKRNLSLPRRVAAVGGVKEWNDQTQEQQALVTMLTNMVTAKTKDEVLVQVTAMVELGNYLWAYMYMRRLAALDMELCYTVIMEHAEYLLPVMYTPTVGEVCQKFGMLPFYRRGCYLSISQRGNLKEVLKEYAEAELPKDADGKPLCQCIVFSDGGRILGLGDLGAWGMGIPVGKLDLYTCCGGFNPHQTIPLIIDAGNYDPPGNTAHLTIREHPMYTGEKTNRVTHKSEAGTVVNTCYYGEGNFIEEFMNATVDLFGKGCLMQFEDFNSNDAFPLLETYRNKYLCYNDDIQGTAAVTVAGILGAIKMKNPKCTDLLAALKNETFLFHGAGSANIGALQLLNHEAGVPLSKLFVTNSRGIIWKSEDGNEGSHRNNEQKEFACIGQPTFNSKDLAASVRALHPSILVGAVGVVPNCFTKDVVDAMMEVSDGERPIIFALSNPKSQSEITAENAFTWSQGQAILGTGTYFDPVTINGREHHVGQVNNVYIFPGVSFGSYACQAKSIPDSFFLKAAEAVANSLSAEDFQQDLVIPRRSRAREVGLNVAAAVVYEAQKQGLAGKSLGTTPEEVKSAVKALMWEPGMGKKK
jgi:malate dehydrogenase (oxaloacetate-decarboxylating)(NADP+)